MTDLETSASEWIDRWDRQQEVYIPRREERFDVVFTAIEQLVGGERPLRILDLGCGPGAIGTRALLRFHDAAYVGLDIDPVLLHLAGQAGDAFGDRYAVQAADLAIEGWDSAIADATFDAVVSSTALHWLDLDRLRSALACALRVLRPAGIFVDADNLSFDSRILQQASDRIGAQNEAVRSKADAPTIETWHEWWHNARVDPVLGPLCEARDLRFPPNDAEDAPPPLLSDYIDVLEKVGFEHVDTVWQQFDDRVLVGMKPAVLA